MKKSRQVGVAVLAVWVFEAFSRLIFRLYFWQAAKTGHSKIRFVGIFLLFTITFHHLKNILNFSLLRLNFFRSRAVSIIVELVFGSGFKFLGVFRAIFFRLVLETLIGGSPYFEMIGTKHFDAFNCFPTKLFLWIRLR